jgi:predicted AlkP superfamily pyrophosphatase or phosphodiesterase
MTSTKGNHGYDPNQPGMHATFVAWGQGIKPGATLDKIENTDVAPTVAALLGLKMNDVDGKVLDAVLAR